MEHVRAWVCRAWPDGERPFECAAERPRPGAFERAPAHESHRSEGSAADRRVGMGDGRLRRAPARRRPKRDAQARHGGWEARLRPLPGRWLFFSFFPGLFRVALRFFAEWAVHARKVNFAPATVSNFLIRNYWKWNSPSGNQDLQPAFVTPGQGESPLHRPSPIPLAFPLCGRGSVPVLGRQVTTIK